MSIEKKKKQIKKDCLEDESVGSKYLYKLISTNTLDDMLRLLKKDKLFHNSKCIYGKDNFTYSEQLINIFDNFIFIFDRDFPVLGGLKLVILECLFKNCIPNFLLSKRYWGDNMNIPYFQNEIKKFVVDGFYKNIEELRESLPIKITNKYFRDYDLEDTKDLNELYDLMKSLVWSSSEFFNIHLIFLDYNKSLSNEPLSFKMKSAKYNFYLTQWEWLFKIYETKKEYVKKIIQI